jgi:hypothetical protein
LADDAARGTALDEAAFEDARAGVAAMKGLKFAEDWLLRSLLAGKVPSGRTVLSSGAATSEMDSDLRDFLAELDGELHIAATADYPLYPSSPAHSIPRIDAESTADGSCRYYFLTSSSGVAGKNMLTTEEELLAVYTDHNGALTGTRRVLHRSRTEKKR